MQYITGTEFNIKKNKSHYVNDRTDDWNQSLDGNQEFYWYIRCRFFKEQQEAVQNLLTECKMLANRQYLAKHNRVLMVMTVVWAKEQNLLDRNVSCYQEKWNRRQVLENSQAELVWTSTSTYLKQQHLEGQIWCLKRNK